MSSIFCCCFSRNGNESITEADHPRKSNNNTNAVAQNIFSQGTNYGTMSKSVQFNDEPPIRSILKSKTDQTTPRSKSIDSQVSRAENDCSLSPSFTERESNASTARSRMENDCSPAPSFGSPERSCDSP